MNETCAWVTDMQTVADKLLRFMKVPEPPTETLPIVQAGRKHSLGLAFDEESFPRVAKWPGMLGGQTKELPAIFGCGGFVTLTAKARDIFVSHDMGSATLPQLTLYEWDGTTLFSDRLFMLNFGDRKDSLVNVDSPKLRRVAYQTEDMWKLPFLEDRSDDDVVLNSAALAGADLWTDASMRSAIFISDRLRTALCKARIDEAFKLTRCPIKT